MEVRINEISIPERETKQAALCAAFNMTTSGAKKGKGKMTEREDNADAMDADEEEAEPEEIEGREQDIVNNNDRAEEDPEDGESGAERAARQEKVKVVTSTCLSRLYSEATDAIKVLFSSPKVTGIEAHGLYEPWARKSSVSSNALPNSFRGQNLIAWHTWEWGASPSQSRSRFLRILACAAIFEHAAIANYRHDLLADPRGGPCFIRCLLDRATCPYRIKVVQKMLQQTMLDGEKRKAAETVRVAISMTWPDEIEVPECTVNGFDFSKAIARYNCSICKEDQRIQLQSIVNAVETQCIAWNDTTNTADVRENPAINAKVQFALELLVNVSRPSLISSLEKSNRVCGACKALKYNAYTQHSGIRSHQVEQSEADAEMEELQVELRGTSDLVGTGKQDNKKFLLRSATEENEHPKRVQVEHEAFLSALQDSGVESPSVKMNDRSEFLFIILQN